MIVASVERGSVSTARSSSSRLGALASGSAARIPATAVQPIAAGRRQATAGVGAQLRVRRQAAGLSLRQFAKTLGVSASFISQLENGKSQPSVGTLYLICGALDVTVDELFAEAGLAKSEVQPADAPPSRQSEQAQRDQSNPRAGAPMAIGSIHAGSDGPVVRPDGRRRLILDTGVTWEQLSSAHERAIDFMYVTYEGGGSSTIDERLTRHSGIEYGFIIRGELHVTLGFETHRVGPGDAISFDSSTPHRLHNRGKTPAEGIWFVHGRDAS